MQSHFETINSERLNPSRVEAIHHLFEAKNSGIPSPPLARHFSKKRKNISEFGH